MPLKSFEFFQPATLRSLGSLHFQRKRARRTAETSSGAHTHTHTRTRERARTDYQRYGRHTIRRRHTSVVGRIESSHLRKDQPTDPLEGLSHETHTEQWLFTRVRTARTPPRSRRTSSRTCGRTRESARTPATSVTSASPRSLTSLSTGESTRMRSRLRVTNVRIGHREKIISSCTSADMGNTLSSRPQMRVPTAQ